MVVRPTAPSMLCHFDFVWSKTKLFLRFYILVSYAVVVLSDLHRWHLDAVGDDPAKLVFNIWFVSAL